MRLFATVLLLIAVTGASATTIDFEEFANNPSFQPVFEIQSQGFVFSSSYSAIGDGSDDQGLTIIAAAPAPTTIYGEASLYALPNSGPIQNAVLDMYDMNDDLFSLNSFIGLTGRFMHVTGSYGIIDAYSESTNTLASIDLGNGFTQYSLPNTWVDLTSVQFDTQYGSNEWVFVDNVTVNSAFVPIPAAAWLFGSALAGLGWLRRKQAFSV